MCRIWTDKLIRILLLDVFATPLPAIDRRRLRRRAGHGQRLPAVDGRGRRGHNDSRGPQHLHDPRLGHTAALVLHAARVDTLVGAVDIFNVHLRAAAQPAGQRHLRQPHAASRRRIKVHPVLAPEKGQFRRALGEADQRNLGALHHGSGGEEGEVQEVQLRECADGLVPNVAAMENLAPAGFTSVLAEKGGGILVGEAGDGEVYGGRGEGTAGLDFRGQSSQVVEERGGYVRQVAAALQFHVNFDAFPVCVWGGGKTKKKRWFFKPIKTNTLHIIYRVYHCRSVSKKPFDFSFFVKIFQRNGFFPLRRIKNSVFFNLFENFVENLNKNDVFIVLSGMHLCCVRFRIDTQLRIGGKMWG